MKFAVLVVVAVDGGGEIEFALVVCPYLGEELNLQLSCFCEGLSVF